ncbi:DEKNAAC101181 [Brettanomyces naardenensis]|uniref:DEKNAAC101181 n=1 Tax=Brettanomyces naardenensis TaxID=13370 RepID=A0A448YHH3_BRENA|nr:DEKNAAC101181 [Brettanomyces naardenensis]
MVSIPNAYYYPFLAARGDSSSSTSSSCVTCSGAPKCPVCGNDEQCAMTTQTCAKCPTTYCTKMTTSLGTDDPKGSSLTSAKIGGIAAGASVFALILMSLLSFYIYKKWWLKRHPRKIYDEEDEEDEDNDSEHPWKEGQDPRRMSQASFATTAASSVLTKASNVLNVAYIPGVKIRAGKARSPTSPKPSSIYSKETYLSGLEDASFHAGQVASKGSAPQLVSITEDSYDFDGEEKGGKEAINPIIEEEEEEEEEDNGNGNEKGAVVRDRSAKGTGFAPLILKPTAKPLESDSGSETESDSEDSDSDEENIELITAQLKQKNGTNSSTGSQTLYSRTLKSSKGSYKDSSRGGTDIPLEIVNPDAEERKAEKDVGTGKASNGGTSSTTDDYLLKVEFDDNDGSNPFETPFD